MASALKKFGEKILGDSKQLKKLFKEITPGGRILPTRTSKKDAEYQCRLDMGEEITGKPGYYNVYLQVNTQAKSEGLKNWLRKNPHGNLATTQINKNVLESEQDNEGRRVVEDLIEMGRRNL
ncbi:hypothetical protein TRV_00665 [Trichophyton verrucosum HKI 0517]|uniref:Uncharacterized protein n=1 Tax=Trichophyton verrucosum (strain HKI 0517) TaxID=663202 RepID=D4D0S0_TRIVH|nr:uncharacterized protein TRV_00665 [Trichophyton verrucosum HKI 0517]EFE44529.1 hypothetical protein TRV_00665 [Trichophyton verrucosum HKI 0517]